MLGAFACGAVLFTHLLALPGEDRIVHQVLFSWVPVGGVLRVDFGLQLDALSMCFVLLITGVGALIHIYSIGYMKTDPGRAGFFAYLNLFVAAMLLLVLADNYLGLYLGWEGVGLASYLLIGFWAHKPSAATAAKKGVRGQPGRRHGGAGDRIDGAVRQPRLSHLQHRVRCGAADDLRCPDRRRLAAAPRRLRQERPSPIAVLARRRHGRPPHPPVSALIHAATMVTAGVYLIVRSGPIFTAAPAAQTAVVTVGAVTLLFGAIIGCAKDDIKKALAASTMSQIGYMVLAAGLGPAGYAVAIMHLLTHGFFFKAGLFLGAGSVMHAMNDETDMRRYGGLRTLLPITFVTFGLGYLAIIGVPPFAGYFSKDAIIETAFNTGGLQGFLLGGAALLGAGITAFYMTRVMLLTFFGQRRWKPDTHPHESPASMTAPMIILAIGSVGAGALLAIGNTLQHWLEPVVGHHETEHLIPPAWIITLTALGVVAIGIAVAYRQYANHKVPETAPLDVSALTVAARNDLYGDAFNEAAFMRTGQGLTKGLVAVDEKGVDGVTQGLAYLVGRISDRLRQVQTGFARSYALSMLAGAALVVAAVLFTAWR